MKRFVLLLFWSSLLAAQSNRGELRLKVVDPAGLGVRTNATLVSEANQYRTTLATDDQGALDVQRLPYGIYQLTIEQTGYAVVSETIDIHSSVPVQRSITLKLAPVNETVTVQSEPTLLDPDQAGSVNQIGRAAIQDRLTSIPGRSIQDLVNTQPGWLYEGNAVLHPRGSEYQTQFVVDGIPLTDNRSPSFGPEVAGGASDVDSMTIYTAGFPAEYGRKMGGVVEVNTLHDPQPGFHGQIVLSGGSFDSAGSFAQAQYTWGKNVLGFTASGSQTSHYLNPVVPENYTNTGTIGDFSVNYQRDLTPNDRLNFIARYELSRYQLPNEIVQQTWCYAPGQTQGPPCQQQNANNFETMGIVSYRHIFSPRAVGDFRGMLRNNGNDFYSNDLSTPIILFQHNWFNEGYFAGTFTIDHGRNEWKMGAESDNTFLHENFAYQITDPSQFDPGTALAFSFPGAYPSQGQRPDLEQSAFVQDLVRMGNWTANLGLRYDHYQLVVNKQAVEPRIAISRYFPAIGLIAHVSYDRIFQTPSFENLLLSSSFEVDLINPDVLRLPVIPSQGNYYEAGVSKAFGNNLRLDVNYYLRDVANYADDDQIDNTTISFPIAFRKAVIYGAEGKISVPNWHKISGFASYSYMVGNAWFPVSGGLFIGADAQAAISQLTGHFPDSQDQRNTLFTRWVYQIKPRLWFGGGIQYGTGLPFDFQGTEQEALQEYGPEVISRINFARGRIDPSLLVSASAGVDVYKSDRMKVSYQIDGQNLTNVLDVIDFGGLFSGNAIGPPRS
ncbi:MAG TPA: TonB-dependent receptor, partial [Bryocella sp.]|nr:TonB-dependent receptor [Bryocella sp.]